MFPLIDKEMIAAVVLEFETGDRKAFDGTIVQIINSGNRNEFKFSLPMGFIGDLEECVLEGIIIILDGEIIYRTVIPSPERFRFDKHCAFDFSGTIMLRKAVTCELVEDDVSKYKCGTYKTAKHDDYIINKAVNAASEIVGTDVTNKLCFTVWDKEYKDYVNEVITSSKEECVTVLRPDGEKLDFDYMTYCMTYGYHTNNDGCSKTVVLLKNKLIWGTNHEDLIDTYVEYWTYHAVAKILLDSINSPLVYMRKDYVLTTCLLTNELISVLKIYRDNPHGIPQNLKDVMDEVMTSVIKLYAIPVRERVDAMDAARRAIDRLFIGYY